MSERTEGWGSVNNCAKAHYFRDKESLCRKWLALTGVWWESNQEKGETADSGTCKACWKKAPNDEPKPTGGVSA